MFVKLARPKNTKKSDNSRDIQQTIMRWFGKSDGLLFALRRHRKQIYIILVFKFNYNYTIWRRLCFCYAYVFRYIKGAKKNNSLFVGKCFPIRWNIDKAFCEFYLFSQNANQLQCSNNGSKKKRVRTEHKMQNKSSDPGPTLLECKHTHIHTHINMCIMDLFSINGVSVHINDKKFLIGFRARQKLFSIYTGWNIFVCRIWYHLFFESKRYDVRTWWHFNSR